MSEQKLPMFCPSCGKLTEDLCPYCRKCFNCCGSVEYPCDQPQTDTSFIAHNLPIHGVKGKPKR